MAMSRFGRFLLLALCLLSYHVEAATCFNTGCGTGSSDLLSTTSTITPGTSYSIAWWMFNTASAGSPITMDDSTNNANWITYFNGSATEMDISAFWSGGQVKWHITTEPSGSWAHNC